MNAIIEYIRRIKVDIPMLAAAVVEVPRWYVAFAAIKEPWWAAVPMGLLLAWGASAGWKAYFENKSRYLLLLINIASLAGALIVIAPVLYAMTFTPLDEINLSLILEPWALATWAGILAITTFVPLVQLAAVSMYNKPAAQSEKAQTEPAADAQPTPEPPDAIEPDAPPAPPDPAQVIHAQTVTEKQAKKHTKAKAHRRKPVTGMTPAQRRAQIVELELTDAKDVQKQFGGSLRRAQMDLAAVKGEGQ